MQAICRYSAVLIVRTFNNQAITTTKVWKTQSSNNILKEWRHWHSPSSSIDKVLKLGSRRELTTLPLKRRRRQIWDWPVCWHTCRNIVPPSVTRMRKLPFLSLLTIRKLSRLRNNFFAQHMAMFFSYESAKFQLGNHRIIRFEFLDTELLTLGLVKFTINIALFWVDIDHHQMQYRLSLEIFIVTDNYVKLSRLELGVGIFNWNDRYLILSTYSTLATTVILEFLSRIKFFTRKIYGKIS